MSGSSYRNFLQLVKIWPVDPTKSGGRDLGEYIRHCIVVQFRKREATPVNEERCTAVCASLNRIATNKHCDRYPRKFESSALGFTKEECNGILSNEFLKLLKKQRMSYTERLMTSWGLKD